MWKVLVGFIVFAALAMFILMKSGGDIDMGGEKHDVSSHAESEASAAVAAPASEALAAEAAASAASAAASAASM